MPKANCRRIVFLINDIDTTGENQMKFLLVLTLGLASLSLQFANAGDEGAPIDVYVAKLGVQDHFNSKGKRLKSAAAIIRQDRANYHKFGKRDAIDEGDRFFNNKKNRDILELMLNNGYISPTTKRRILDDTPTIVVYVYSNSIRVELQ